MEASKQIETFKEFFDAEYKLQLLEAISTDKGFFIVNFMDVSQFNPELADDLLEDPENVLKAASIAVSQIEQKAHDLEVRFNNLPSSSKVAVSNIRSKNLGKFIQVRGIVRQKSDVRPQVISSKFECPSCGAVIPVLQLDTKFREPTRCQCGRKGFFREVSKQLVDAQKIVLEEASDELEGGEQPKRLNVILKKDLVSPLSERRTNPGSKIEVIGYLMEVAIPLPSGGKSTRFDIMLECNCVEPVEEDYTQLTITPEEEEEIRKLANESEVYQKLIESIAPSIYGHERVKEALLLQMLGGVKKERPDGVVTRGDMHVLLIGDPGSGKCVTGDTLVQLADGQIQPIRTVFEKQQGAQKTENGYEPRTSFEIASLEGHGQGTTNNVKTVWSRTETEPLLRITLRSGTVLTVTQDHPVFIANEGFAEAIAAKDLCKGLALATPRIVRVKTKTQFLPQDGWETKANNTVKIQKPVFLNEDLARLLGYIAGDGWIEKNKRGQPPSLISVTNNDEEVIDDCKNSIRRNFGIEASLRAPHKGKTAKEIMTTSSTLNAYIRAIAPELAATAGGKQIPQIILSSPLSTVSAFLKGLFECDAHVTPTVRTVQYSTKSEVLARQVRMALLRFGIHSQLLLKDKRATNGMRKEKTRYYEVHISGEDVDTYAQHIGFVTHRKRSVFKTHTSKHNTNKDVMPSVKRTLKALRHRYNKQLSDLPIPTGSYKHYEKGDRLPSRRQLKRIIAAYPQEDELDHQLAIFANAEVFWDFVKSIERLPAQPVQVYDFEVEINHTFVAECAYVHNSQLLRRITKIAPKARFVSGKGSSAAGLTATVVKDEFLRGYALEAGALVLANKGFCLTADTEVRTPTGYEHIEELCKRHEQGETIGILGVDYDTLTFKEAIIKNVSRRTANTNSITLENGDGFVITDEHPVLTWDNGYAWKTAGSIQPSDIIITKREFPLPKDYPFLVDVLADRTFVEYNVKKLFGNKSKQWISAGIPKHRLYTGNKLTIADIRTICSIEKKSFDEIKPTITIKDLPQKATPALGAFLGLVLTDGHLSGKKATVAFYNKEKELIDKFVSLSQQLFNITPTVRTYKDRVTTAYFCSEQVHSLLQSFGIEKGAKSRKAMNLRAIRNMPAEFITRFFSNVINGDGAISHRKTGGLISIVGGNKETLEEIRKAARPLGILATVHKRTFTPGKLVSRQTGQSYVLTITGISNFKRIAQEELLTRKRANLQKILRGKDLSGNVPKVNLLFKSLNNKIPHSEKEVLYSNGIKLSQLTHWGIRRATFEKAVGELAELNPAKYTDEVKLFSKLIEQDAVFLKVKEKVPAGEQEVFNLQVDMQHEPNFFANFIPVHNCMVDELDKMSPDDRSAFHEALEQQTVSISKANIQATLRCETVVLAAANPKYGRFDPFELLAKQIDLPSTLLNRFDLIFPIKDVPNKGRDEQMAQFILDMHQKQDVSPAPITSDFLKKYIAYARNHCVPKLSAEALSEIKQFYVDLRSSGKEAEMASIPISARQLEGLVRLAEASAKSRLSQIITKEDARKAIDLVYYCLSQIGIDPMTGKLDIDRVSGIMPASERNIIHQIKDIIKELADVTGNNLVPEEDILLEAKNKGLNEHKVEEALEKLNQKGDIFRPKHGFYSMMK